MEIPITVLDVGGLKKWRCGRSASELAERHLTFSLTQTGSRQAGKLCARLSPSARHRCCRDVDLVCLLLRTWKKKQRGFTRKLLPKLLKQERQPHDHRTSTRKDKSDVKTGLDGGGDAGGGDT